mmetsp:Transcript_6209/g.14298  ORF Transcript_6209/g.14298 Transcript_6209/m.14298 type:complete len:236 (-) Transcript_6209:346-1053(-)
MLSALALKEHFERIGGKERSLTFSQTEQDHGVAVGWLDSCLASVIVNAPVDKRQAPSMEHHPWREKIICVRGISDDWVTAFQQVHSELMSPSCLRLQDHFGRFLPQAQPSRHNVHPRLRSFPSTVFTQHSHAEAMVCIGADRPVQHPVWVLQAILARRVQILQQRTFDMSLHDREVELDHVAPAERLGCFCRCLAVESPEHRARGGIVQAMTGEDFSMLLLQQLLYRVLEVAVDS